MNIFPDSFRCHATRVSCGYHKFLDQAEGDLHFIVGKIPYVELPEKFHRFVKLGIALVFSVMFFSLPWTGFLITPYWVKVAWQKGACRHCDLVDR